MYLIIEVINGKVILYADNKTDSITKVVNETNRRRSIQEEYNKVHNITPKTIIKDIGEALVVETAVENEKIDVGTYADMSTLERKQLIQKLEEEMKEAASKLDFEQALSLRDVIFELKAMGEKNGKRKK
jgi:excinuclease ABC subunit B